MPGFFCQVDLEKKALHTYDLLCSNTTINSKLEGPMEALKKSL